MPTPPQDPPHLPYDELRAHAGDDPQVHTSLDAIQTALREPRAERSHVQEHIDILRGVPAIAATIENWYEQPSTQSWLKTLSDIGL